MGLASRRARAARARARRSRGRPPERGRVGRLVGLRRRRVRAVADRGGVVGRGPLARRLHGAARVCPHSRRPARPRRGDDPVARRALRRLVGERRLRGERRRRRLLPRRSARALRPRQGGESATRRRRRCEEPWPLDGVARHRRRGTSCAATTACSPPPWRDVTPASGSASRQTRWTAGTTSASAARASWPIGSMRTPGSGRYARGDDERPPP